MKVYRTVLATAAVVVAASAGAALAAPTGVESPTNCSFAGGATTCSNVGTPVVSTSSPDTNGCTTTTTTVTTTYTRHRGVFNSHGVLLPAPAATIVVTDSGTSCTQQVTMRSLCEGIPATYTEGGTAATPDGVQSTYFSCGVGNNLTIDQLAGLGLLRLFKGYCWNQYNGEQSMWNATAGYDPEAYPQTVTSGYYFVCYQQAASSGGV